ncbi:Hpt domain-containing protein [Acinetobacter silvestris]|uniref:Chemotaxis protein CheA n=1 Tax=Acinetobacter silvestris TaxID=1977882 RepID=A0A1Y3CI61_9GAMM|nr:Hpt domain-containing protein [Acinetobacter silvestris]OTG65582.1 hybrid sensor histidine kinase/response regulator [Acinetobacter silvestris]
MKEILKHLVESTVLPEDSYLEQDAEILEIFIEELEEIFESLQPLLSQWIQDPTQDEVLLNIRRHYHTLKGSGRMVGAKSSGELAWTVEEALNRVIAKSLVISAPLQSYVNLVFNTYKYKLYNDFNNNQVHQIDLRPLVLLGQQIQKNVSIEPALEELLVLSTMLNAENVITGLEKVDIDAQSAPAAPVISVEENVAVSAASISEETFARVSGVDIAHHEAIEPRNEELISAETNTSLAQSHQGEYPSQRSDEGDQFLTETLAIFVEESEEHLAAIEAFLQLEHHTPEQYNRLIRALHTLRGSSSMAHVDDVFEVSGKVEQLFKVLVQADTESSTNENALLTHYAEFVRDYLHVLKQDGASDIKLQSIYQVFNRAWDRYDFQIEQLQDQASEHDLISQLVSLNIDYLLDAEFEFDKRAKVDYPHYFEQLIDQTSQLIKHTENRASQGIHEFSLELKACYIAVLGTPALLNTDYAFELFSKVHQEFIHLFDTLASGQRVSLNDDSKQALDEISAYLQQDIDSVESDLSTTIEPMSVAEAVPIAASVFDLSSITAQILEDKKQLDSTESHRDFDLEVLDIFIEEADELLINIDHDLNTWSKNLSDTTALKNLMRHLHTLKGGANMVQAEHIGWIAHELETIYERMIKKQMQATPELVQVIRIVQDNIADRLQMIHEQHVDYPAQNVLSILRGLGKHQVEVTTPVETYAATTATATSDLELVDDLVDVADLTPAALILEGTVEDDSNSENEPDQAELIARETFFEEAEELLDDSKHILSLWFDQRNNRSLLLQLQRIAHSIKGGAKMVRLEQVAEIAYELENVFEQFAVHNFSSNVYDSLLDMAFNWLKDAIKEQNYQHYDKLKSNLANITYVDVAVQLPNKLTRADLLSDFKPTDFVAGDGVEPPSMFGEWGQSHHADQNDEMIRISADLIEKMIDLSGENAINRSRIEMDLGQFGNTLSDMELAIQRLVDQLRRMEGELESQIIAKHGDLNSRYTDFDPLEMDQYSSLNQLSKSLAESASDLIDFKTTLSEKIRDTESLLLQQSRIQAEIQESLMRTRLVPFSRLLPRLQRLVRQTSTTLNKPTELLVNNTEGELDRTILEKLISPLEHMLRNAIDHGIEDASGRQNSQKSKTGRIDLNISRQGTDVIVTFTDDGKGIDAEKIKAKALEQGLITAEQQLTSDEILQLIFHPGFSTAQQVTQISGRGVGLDVVQSEIKLLGGQVTVHSELGKGSTFTIQVPTTVSVSDALMVKIGDQQFAVPLSQIDRIVRISPTALDEYFSSKSEFFEIDHQSYKLRYLAEFVAHQPVPRLHGIAHSLPVLLIKGSMGQTIAVLVDQLIGSRSQIVVKPIGQQFSNIGVITGATILGDGHVCLILDGQNIARQIQANHRVKDDGEHRDNQRHRDQRRLVMIVDDSVTVRKVTTRLLERNGFDVITAKDGVDAIEQLENVKPDLMLLDIEMPRMDGFEVTNLVRHHEVHRELPIIMITSRTGEKHRERAFSLGVTNYMGKPFQESELLENITALLETR